MPHWEGARAELWEAKRLQDKLCWNRISPVQCLASRRAENSPRAVLVAQQSLWQQGSLCSVSALCLGLSPSLEIFPLLFCGIYRHNHWWRIQGSNVTKWAISNVSYGYNIHESKLSRHVGTVVYFQGSTCHSQKVKSISNPEQPSLQTGVLVCNDFGSAKTQFSAPPSSCSSVAARGKTVLLVLRL